MKTKILFLALLLIVALAACAPTPAPTAVPTPVPPTQPPTPKPNLVVQNATIKWTDKTVSITVKNNGNGNAGAHLTYIEINQVGVADAAKPQSQYSANVSGIAAGSSWSSGPIPFGKFSSPRGLDLSSLTTANLVVRVDAKNMVEESNESDNIYDANQ